jgi:methyl-accepting chemotaxis protein
MTWKVATKISMAFGVLAAVTLGLAVMEWTVGEQVSSELEHLYESGVRGTQELGTAHAVAQRIRGRGFLHIASATPEEKREIEQHLGELEAEMDAALQRAQESFERTADVSDLRHAERIDDVRRRFQAYRATRDADVLTRSRAGDTAGALAAVNTQTNQRFIEAIDALSALIADHVRNNQHIYNRARAALGRANSWSQLGSIGAVLLAIAVAWVMSQSISTRLQRVAGVAQRVSSGDLAGRAQVTGSDEISLVATALNEMAEALSARIDEARAMAEDSAAERQKLADTVAHYGRFVERVARGELNAELEVVGAGTMVELGRNLEAMGKALRTMTLRTHEAVGALSSASAEILTTVQEHGAGANESASAVTETAATVDAVHQSAQRVAEQARHVAEASRQSVEVSSAGRDAVDHTVNTMRDVRKQVDTIAERILLLSEQAQAVSQIITTVNELAEQSNLLALNASIEAARAGDEGRGFSVVAREIRTLADQSRQATAQVRTILGEIQKSTTQAVLETERGSNATAQAEGAVRAAGKHIDQLAETIDEAAGAAQHILAAAEQQVMGVSQISQAMHSITQASRQTVEGTRNVERAVRDLNQLSGNLRDAVAQYRT